MAVAGSAGSPSRATTLDGVVVWATASIVLAASLFRQAGVPKLSTMWAEDGQVFLACAYRESIACLLTPYQGYMHVGPRIGAALAALVPPADASVSVGLFSGIVAALAAGLAARAIATATGSWLAGVLGGAGLALVWQAGREVLGNMANLHWVMFAATLIVLVVSWLGGRLRRTDLVLIGFTGLTSGLSPILAIAAVPGLLRRTPLAAQAFSLAAITAVMQLAVTVGSQRVASADTPVEPVAVVRRFATDVLRDGAFGPDSMPGRWLVPVVLGALLIVLVVARRMSWAKLLPDLLSVAALVGIGGGIYIISAMLNRIVNDRYAYLPSALIVAALAITAARAAAALGPVPAAGRRALAARALVPGVALLCAIGFARSFVLTTRASNGPDVPSEIVAARDRCASDVQSITVDIAPTPASTHWTLSIACDRLR